MVYCGKLLSSVVQVFCVPKDLEKGGGQTLPCFFFFLMVDCRSVLAVCMVHILAREAHSERKTVHIYICTENFLI